MVKGYATINYGLSTIQYYRSTCTVLHASCTLGNCKSCIAIFQQQSSSIKANSFITIANGFDILQLIFQLYLNLSAIIAYADVLVTTEVNSCIRCYINNFATVSGKIPTLVGSFFYSVQLAYVYCIIIINACCYAADFAVLVNTYNAIDYGIAALHVNRCAFTVNNACITCFTIQCYLSTAVADGLNACQILVQLNAVVSYVVVLSFCSYCYIAVTAYGCAVCIYGVNHMSVICGSLVYISNVSATFNLSFSCGCCCADVFQLAIVYSVSICSTFCYVSNLLAVCVQTAAGDICLVAITNASIRHIELSCLYAVYSQVFLQGQTICSNLKVVFTFLKFYRNCIIFSTNGNAIACCISGVFCIYGVNILSVCSCSLIYRCDIGTCLYLCLSSLQLCNVNSISIFSTCCYISNLASLSATAYRNSTFSSFPNVTCSIIFKNTMFRTGCRIVTYLASSSVSYAANAQSNTAFSQYRSTIADCNCIIIRNRILMTEGNNIASVTNFIIVAHYNRIGNFT